MKNQILNSKAVLAILLVFYLFLWGCTPPPVNLVWSKDEPNIIPAAADTLILDELGIADTLYVLEGTTLTSISKTIKNSSSNNLTGGRVFDIQVVVEPFLIQSIDGVVTFIPGGDTIYNQLFSGPSSITAGNSVTFEAATSDLILTCGIYKVSMIIDPASNIEETTDSDNSYSDFISVSSTQQINIEFNQPDPVVVKRPTGRPHLQPVPGPDMPIHGFTITSAGAFSANYIAWNVTGAAASTVTTAPNGPPSPSVVLPLIPPPRPIPVSLPIFLSAAAYIEGTEEILCKVTLISDDGCVIKQKTATILIR